MSDLLMATSDSLAARALLDRLLTLERRAPSRDPVVLASRFDAQGAARFGERRFGDAAVLFGASLSLLERELPPTHQFIRTERQNLAMALLGEGQAARAESLQRVAVEVEDRIRGPATTRAMAREALALTLVRTGRAESAERYEREALALFREGVAPGHWRIWSALRNLAFIAAARGRVADGLALLDSAIVIAASGDGARAKADEAAAYLTAQRVPLLLRLGREAEAARSLDAAEQKLGSSPTVSAEHRADVQRYAGTIELASGRAARAADRFRAAVALTEPLGEPGNPPGINNCMLGVALAQLGQTAEARELLGEACSNYMQDGTADPLLIRWIGEARARVRSTVARTNIR
jgi:tetratricopeptide (TPR) repeat protein